MGVLDKFLNIMKLDDEYEEEEDLFDEEEQQYEDEYEAKPKKGLFKKEQEEYNDFELQPDRGKNTQSASQTSGTANSKVTPMRQPNGRRGATMEVCVVKPTTVKEEREITETLLSGRTIILNLEGLELEIAQRIVDFVSGAAYAIGGNLEKISDFIFLITPTNVTITGEIQELMDTSFDTPSIRTRF